MNNIFQTLLYQREKQKDTVLATIVWDDGSAPRGAGSQMLVGAEGLLSGTIGGGAVEGNTIAKAKALLQERRSAVHEYRLHRNKVADIGMVCGGARLDPDLSGFFLALGLPVLQGYGQSEAGPVISKV